MEQFKNTMIKVWHKIHYVVTRRVFAGALMCAITLSMAFGISVNSHVVTVNDGDDSRVVVTMRDDPYKVLSDAGVSLDVHDAVTVDAETKEIDVDRAVVVEVQADGLSTLVHMTEGTVADALNKAEVSIGNLDRVSYKVKTPIKEGMLIKVDRVAYEEYTVTETIPYETKYRYTAVLQPGVTKLDKSGSNGKRTLTYRKVIVNGKVEETKVIDEDITKKPVTQVVIKGSNYGTPISKAPFKVALNSKNQPVNYKKKFSGRCTAYATGSYGASGRRLGVGTVAVDPKKIPYGSKLWITSADGKFVYGYAIAADTGSFIRDGRTVADLYMGSYQECCWFGARNLNVYVIG